MILGKELQKHLLVSYERYTCASFVNKKRNNIEEYFIKNKKTFMAFFILDHKKLLSKLGIRNNQISTSKDTESDIYWKSAMFEIIEDLTFRDDKYICLESLYVIIISFLIYEKYVPFTAENYNTKLFSKVTLDFNLVNYMRSLPSEKDFDMMDFYSKVDIVNDIAVLRASSNVSDFFIKEFVEFERVYDFDDELATIKILNTKNYCNVITKKGRPVFYIFNYIDKGFVGEYYGMVIHTDEFTKICNVFKEVLRNIEKKRYTIEREGDDILFKYPEYDIDNVVKFLTLLSRKHDDNIFKTSSLIFNDEEYNFFLSLLDAFGTCKTSYTRVCYQENNSIKFETLKPFGQFGVKFGILNDAEKYVNVANKNMFSSEMINVFQITKLMLSKTSFSLTSPMIGRIYKRLHEYKDSDKANLSLNNYQVKQAFSVLKNIIRSYSGITEISEEDEKRISLVEKKLLFSTISGFMITRNMGYSIDYFLSSGTKIDLDKYFDFILFDLIWQFESFIEKSNMIPLDIHLKNILVFEYTDILYECGHSGDIVVEYKHQKDTYNFRSGGIRFSIVDLNRFLVKKLDNLHLAHNSYLITDYSDTIESARRSFIVKLKEIISSVFGKDSNYYDFEYSISLIPQFVKKINMETFSETPMETYTFDTKNIESVDSVLQAQRKYFVDYSDLKIKEELN